MKDAPALWMVSHCQTRSKREDYVESMSSYMNITIKGKKAFRAKFYKNGC